MPTPALLPFDELLEPISADDPAGDTVPFAVRQKLEEFRKEVDPKNFAPDDPMRPEERKYADWSGIIRLVQETLREKSKDLLIAARLTEALTKKHGFGGLRDGFLLMRRMLEECWDRMHPSIEDGDIEVRGAPFSWLDDPDRGARFPNSIRNVPLALQGEDTFGWQQWKQTQEGRGQTTAEAFEKAVIATPRSYCQTNVEDLAGARQELDALNNVLGEKLGDNAPGLVAIQKALAECETLAQQLLRRKGSGDESASAQETSAAAGAAPAGQTAEASSGPSAPVRRMQTRDDIYQNLREAAIRLQQLEPHSPIPYLVLRACDLGAMPWPQLMRALIRDDNIISELNREFGVKEEQPQ